MVFLWYIYLIHADRADLRALGNIEINKQCRFTGEGRQYLRVWTTAHIGIYKIWIYGEFQTMIANL